MIKTQNNGALRTKLKIHSGRSQKIAPAISAASTANRTSICGHSWASASEFQSSLRSNDGSRNNRTRQYAASNHSAGMIGNGNGLKRKPKGKSTNSKTNSAINNFERILFFNGN